MTHLQMRNTDPFGDGETGTEGSSGGLLDEGPSDEGISGGPSDEGPSEEGISM